MDDRFEKIGLLTARAGNGEGYSIEIHRSAGCQLNVLHRRWHVLSFYPSEQTVLRIGPKHKARLVQSKGHVGVYPAGSSEQVLWKGPVEGLHLHIDPRSVTNDRGQIVQIHRKDGLGSQQLRQLLSALYEEVRSEDRNNLEPEAKLVSFIRQELAQAEQGSALLLDRPRIGRTRIDKILDAMHGRQAVSSTNNSLSSLSKLSPAEFSRQFRRVIGASPHDYLIRSRIEQCKHALYSGQTRLSEIALENGFYDQAHFTKTFKRQVGLTPTDYMHWFDR